VSRRNRGSWLDREQGKEKEGADRWGRPVSEKKEEREGKRARAGLSAGGGKENGPWGKEREKERMGLCERERGMGRGND
jgi:hypothetical protein